MSPSRSIVAASLSLLAACGSSGTAGGGGGDDVQPTDAAPTAIDAAADAALPAPHLVAGGGVTGPAIAGALNVYVVEAGTSTAIANALIQLGATGAMTGVTGHDGLHVFADPSLTGPQTITVTAAGHTAATWVGAAGANVTIPLAPQPRVTPTAHAAGTIAGWSDLPAPAFGHYTLGVVLATFTADVGAPENTLAQATASGGTPANTCTRTSAAATTCAWQLTARTGRQRHVAVIVDGDAHATASDTSDDTYTLIGYAMSASMTLTSGQSVTGESLTRVGATALTNLTVAFPAAPSGLSKVVAIPMLDLGDDGRVPFPLPTVAPGHTSAQVIAPTGEYAGSYHVVALATPSTTMSMPYSTVMVDSVTPGTTATIAPWLATPSAIHGSSGSYGFTAATGATLHYATFSHADGTALWTVALLDGSSSFTLPTVSPDPIGAGALTMTVLGTELTGFQAGEFQVPALTTALRRAAAAASASVTR